MESHFGGAIVQVAGMLQQEKVYRFIRSRFELCRVTDGAMIGLRVSRGQGEAKIVGQSLDLEPTLSPQSLHFAQSMKWVSTCAYRI